MNVLKTFGVILGSLIIVSLIISAIMYATFMVSFWIFPEPISIVIGGFVTTSVILTLVYHLYDRIDDFFQKMERRSLIRKTVGSCNCGTKTPDHNFHTDDCRYREYMSRF